MTLFIQIDGIIHHILFHIINCGNVNMILSVPWLEKTKPHDQLGKAHG